MVWEAELPPVGANGSPDMICILVCDDGEERYLAMVLAAMSAPSFPMLELCACTFRMLGAT